jgi:hypothetical protein
LASRGLLDKGLRYLLASHKRIKSDLPISAVSRSRRSLMIESDKSQSRISRSIRARTASPPEKIKFIEISRAPPKSCCLNFATKQIRSQTEGNSSNLSPIFLCSRLEPECAWPAMNSKQRLCQSSDQRPAGAPLIMIKSIGPPGLSSSKTPTVSRPVRQASVSRLVRPS